MPRYAFQQLRAFDDVLLDALEASPDADAFRSGRIDREAGQVVHTFKGDPTRWRETARTLVPDGAYRVELLPGDVDVYGVG